MFSTNNMCTNKRQQAEISLEYSSLLIVANNQLSFVLFFCRNLIYPIQLQETTNIYRESWKSRTEYTYLQK